ncbi:ABC transporter permease [Salisediminibacterium halotolerans]|uniref:ABC-2 type transport system permease protein n=1 Tax=Salisediminibacterium halotolerans TaxID=517425 RepID=A0A1H9U410_9BACI|nr:ABC transporter permease [Salisediminibacterium haloalkalitolerans]SES03968.1 ABC-2 type transport system permease protein [Salisediminibacterium haloalkalitolerans]
MRNYIITVQHTVIRRVKSKAFIFTALIMSVLILGMFALSYFLGESGPADDSAENSPGSVMTVNVLDDTETGGSLVEKLTAYGNGNMNFTEQADSLSDKREEASEDGEYVLRLSGNLADLEASLYHDEQGFEGTGPEREVQGYVERAKEDLIAEEMNLSEEQRALLFDPLVVSGEPLDQSEGAPSDETFMQSYWMVYGLVFAIYLIVIMFGSMIATEVATEKSSRVMELIVSSVNPVTQMLGKITGIGIVGFLNLAVIAAAVSAGSLLTGEHFLTQVVTEMIDYSLLVYALMFILFGYLIYGGAAAMLGALVSRSEEVNQAIQPLIFLAMIAFFISIFGLNAPDLTMIRVLSYIPFFTPQLLFLRIGMTSVPAWEIALIMTLLVISAVLILLLAARIYKGGVLMYGKFSYKEGIKQALSISKKEA